MEAITTANWSQAASSRSMVLTAGIKVTPRALVGFSMSFRSVVTKKHSVAETY